MAIERKWEAIPPRSLAQDGTAEGIVELSDARGFKVKQTVILRATGEPNLTLEVKRFLSPTQFRVGPTNSSLFTCSDISAYTVAKNATIEAQEQSRPSIPDKEFERAVYEEEPTVAKRVLLVDDFGNPYNDDNPLNVEATVNQNLAQNRFGYRKNYTTADVEESQLLPNNTRKLYIAVADKSAKLRVSFQENGTLISGSNDFVTVEYGNSYFLENVKLVNKTIYYQASKSNIEIEIETWT